MNETGLELIILLKYLYIAVNDPEKNATISNDTYQKVWM